MQRTTETNRQGVYISSSLLQTLLQEMNFVRMSFLVLHLHFLDPLRLMDLRKDPRGSAGTRCFEALSNGRAPGCHRGFPGAPWGAPVGSLAAFPPAFRRRPL